MSDPKPKYKRGDVVQIKGSSRCFTVWKMEMHGYGVCECCATDPYFVYYQNENRFINENQLLPVSN